MDINLSTLIYAGLFVTPESKKILEQLFINNIDNAVNYLNNNKVYISHCTMLFNDGRLSDDKSKTIINYLEQLDDNTHFDLVVDGIGQYQSVYAFRIKNSQFTNEFVKNKQPHITCVLDPTINKPVDSNKITNWINVDPIHIDTVCKLFVKYKKNKK